MLDEDDNRNGISVSQIPNLGNLNQLGVGNINQTSKDMMNNHKSTGNRSLLNKDTL